MHSPYSLHPDLLKKIIKFIKKNNLLASVHFLESKYERKWLQKSSGRFKKFFGTFFKLQTSAMNLEYFLEKISSLSHLLFTHNNYIEKKEFNFLLKNKSKFYATHCPVSNRILGNKKIKFSYMKKLNTNIGTDGLSSNISLNIFDELRSALLIYSKIKIKNLAKQLILSATKNGAKALNINSGEVSVGKNADLILITLPDMCKKKDVALNTILHTKKVSKSFIDGILVYEQ
ncbi:S-adenosylhomocysteine deaminase; Methylthioadenosine deaminase [hydrothermal vent metagenome]|uniref:S-adenosylhomocysteine deaminase Methylthioadenosine deaminase n=1 Tax=hydrothermal vent metagenome TaxID=652676 RepID=A0A3B1EA87_9ZZZZ